MAASRRVVQVGIGAVLLVALGLSGWAIAGQVRTWRQLTAARAALARDDPAAARTHLAVCLRAWPDSGEVQFLAAQAARRTGDLAEAVRRLDTAAELGWVDQAIDLERALLQVQTGDLPAAEKYLQQCLKAEHPDSALIVEILTPAYIRNYQMDQAGDTVGRWLALRPDSPLAWYNAGVILEHKLLKPKAAEAYGKAAELDPTRKSYRLGLARMLNVMNRPAEARPVAEALAAEYPDDAEVQIELAKSRQGLGEPDRAAAVLDRIIKRYPAHGDAVFLRGKLDLERGRAADAIGPLRRAAELQPHDPVVLYTLLRCLQQVGKPAEIAACERQMKQAEQDLDRLSALTKAISADPNNVDLRAQAGDIYLRNGKEEEGFRWLSSALALRPNHPAAHRALAEHYQRKGRPAEAALHRRIAEAGSSPR